MSKTKNVNHIHKVYRLVRSDNTLILLGLLSVALLLSGLYMYNQTKLTTEAQATTTEERTYRVESAPAVMSDVESEYDSESDSE